MRQLLSYAKTERSQERDPGGSPTSSRESSITGYGRCYSEGPAHERPGWRCPGQRAGVTILNSSFRLRMISSQEVVMAYRLILGREPESEAVVADHCRRHESLSALRAAFLNSAEFQARVADYGPSVSVDIDVEPAMLQQMFMRIEECWQALGETEPYWSVASCDQFKSNRFAAHAGEFYDSGKRDMERLLVWLSRNRIELESIRSCAEYGCGVGRVTTWLCAQFPRVFAYDISAPHLRLASQRLSEDGRTNVTFSKIATISSLASLEPADLVVTLIVLQHNPPPVLAHILRALLRSIRPRGVAFFQLPTYGTGYGFDACQYLTRAAPAGSFEMHVLPQQSVFQIVHDEGFAVLEVQPDHFVGRPNWISNTFLVQRR